MRWLLERYRRLPAIAAGTLALAVCYPVAFGVGAVAVRAAAPIAQRMQSISTSVVALYVVLSCVTCVVVTVLFCWAMSLRREPTTRVRVVAMAASCGFPAVATYQNRFDLREMPEEFAAAWAVIGLTAAFAWWLSRHVKAKSLAQRAIAAGSAHP